MAIPEPLRPTRVLRRLHLAGVAIAQALLILLMVHHRWAVWVSRPIALPGDASIYLWFLSWWAWAIQHGVSLAHTGLVVAPWGNNVLWDTSVPLIFIPLSVMVQHHLLSLPLGYNLATFGGWWFSAVLAYWSYYLITRRIGASAAGSLLVLASAYFTNQALGHADLMWVGFSYLLFAYAYLFGTRRLSARGLAWRWMLLGGCLWLTNEEYFVTTTVMVCLGLLFWIRWEVRAHLWSWPDIRRIATGAGLSLALTLALVTPLMWWQIHTPDQPFHPFSYLNVYQINAANVIVPVHTWWHYFTAVPLTGNIMEQDGFLGVGFVCGFALLVYFTHREWPPAQKALLAWVLALTVLAFGDFLVVDSRVPTDIPLPGLIFYALPILNNIVLDRIMWGVFWGLGLVVAASLPKLRWARWRIAAGLWLVFVLISWWPAPYPTLSLSANRWISEAVAQHVVNAHTTLLVFPFDVLYDPDNNVLYTQIANHFQYRLVDGYLSANDADIRYFNPLMEFWTIVHLYGPNVPAIRANQAHLGVYHRLFAKFLKDTRPTYVVLTPMAHERYMARWLTQQLGPPASRTGRTWWWRLNRRSLGVKP
ncbi:MAG: hypothetical protein OWU33_13205 [Firmicutes bacterium]|nr:hypothetical protein [Bacillota bacterium]